MTSFPFPYEIDIDDRKLLGRSKERVSAIGLGTWDIRDYRYAEESLILGIELGLDHIDTAEMYDSGLAEELVGRVIKRVGRENVFVTTKLMPDRFTSAEKVLKAARNSLRRLGIGTIDLVLIHWPNWMIPIETQVRYLEELALKGLTRYIGVSNFDILDLKKAVQSTRKHEIMVDQVKYSVLDRWVEQELLPYCVREKITIQAYTPLEKGLVKDNPLLKKLARETGRTPVQVALNYLISHPQVTAIPKTESQQHVREIAGTLGWRVSPEIMHELKSL